MKRIVFRSRAVSALCAVCGGCRGGMRIARAIVFLLPIITIIPSASSCRRETPPQPYVRSIDLEALDASCTEAWLRVRFTDSAAPRAFALKRDGQTILSALNSPPDTLVIDEGLLPNRTYTYRAYRLADSRLIDSTTQVTLTTLDTTSHNWTFVAETLGTSSSVLYDVATVRANPDSPLVYAVGEIYHSDSSQASIPFGFAIWNGSEWRLKRLYYNGTNIIAPIRGIWVMGPTDIWLAAGSVFHWDGVSSQAQLSFSRLTLPDPNATVEKLWGATSLGLYGVGNAGTIVRRDASGTWRRIESGTTAEIKDIWGSVEPLTGEKTILCAVSNQFEPGDRKILRITPQGTVDSLGWRTDRRAASIWFANESRLFVCGGGVFIRRPDGTWVEQTTISFYYTYRIRGITYNDVFVVGGFGLVAHFSGVNWRVWENLGAPIWYSATYSRNLLVAVGQTSNRAVVLKMWR